MQEQYDRKYLLTVIHLIYLLLFMYFETGKRLLPSLRAANIGAALQ